MKCPKCKHKLRQQLSVFVECDAARTDLSKRALRSADVKVLGAGWPQATIYCDGCGYFLRLKSKRGKHDR